MLHLLTPYNVNDLRLSGHVIYVGKSSMEVAVRMESLDSNGKAIQTMMLGSSKNCMTVAVLILYQVASLWSVGTRLHTSLAP